MIKVASYCRVSTDKDDQTNSFASQKRYFREYVKQHTDWELTEIYADEGITGTSTKKRIQFNQMICDAYDGKFQMILTKEVSRFSRNILDTIAYTRELKELGVSVRFVMDGIDTAKPDAELHLAIMASVAQEESRKTSSRVVWGQMRQMEKGVVFGHSLLGYDVCEGKLRINPEGAETVRLIFQKYVLEKMSTTQIAKTLSRDGYLTHHGNTNWTGKAVVKILKNQKYMGDLVQKLTYTPNYLTHKKCTNKGDVPLIRIKDHHEPIIDKDLWNSAQEKLKQNNKRKTRDSGTSCCYTFSGKIKCGCCGASFVGRITTTKDGKAIRRWRCGTAVRKGVCGCDIGRMIRDDKAKDLVKGVIRNLEIDRDLIIYTVTMLVLDALEREEMRTAGQIKRLQAELDHIKEKKQMLIDLYVIGDLSKEDMNVTKIRYEQQEANLCDAIISARKTQKGKNNIRSQETAIQSEVQAILSCEEDCDIFYKAILDRLIICKDGSAEIWLAGFRAPIQIYP